MAQSAEQVLGHKVICEEEAHVRLLAGVNNINIELIGQFFDVRLSAIENQICVDGHVEHVNRTVRFLNLLLSEVKQGRTVTLEELRSRLQAMTLDDDIVQNSQNEKAIFTTYRGKRVTTKSSGQLRYTKCLSEHDVVFCVGPAGTGKSYLAVAYAVALLKAKQVSRIVLVRPAVEAGERLGFLPGDLEEKVNPYLRPLHDALHEFLGPIEVENLSENQAIEIAPLAFMRGRTLNDACILLDEAQNTTVAQMKMFLTRLGRRGRMIVTGDVTQTDLPRGQTSGLQHAIDLLADVPGIGIAHLERGDVVRHSLVQQIVMAYERAAKNDSEGKDDSFA